MNTLPLTKGLAAIVDDEDYARVACFKWTALTPKSGKQYAYRRGSRPEQPIIYLHRFIMDASAGVEVDHRDGDGLNCRRLNLRTCSREQNARNVRKRSDNTSGFKGVHFASDNRKWVAQISYYGKRRHVGTFLTAKEAAIAYDHAATQQFGEFAHLNFPQGEQ